MIISAEQRELLKQTKDIIGDIVGEPFTEQLEHNAIALTILASAMSRHVKRIYPTLLSKYVQNENDRFLLAKVLYLSLMLDIE